MNLHWSRKDSERELKCARSAAFDGKFELEFVRYGNRTSIGRQFVSYPFHLTRPFALDSAIPQLITAYQQSSSGGLYRGEQLSSRFHVRRGAAAHVTTQAATIVHDCQGQPARQTIDIDVEDDAFFALTPDPLILFPGASCGCQQRVALGAQSVLMIADAFSQFDPTAASRPFDKFASDIIVRNSNGRILVRDNAQIAGSALMGSASPIGRWTVSSNFLLLGPSMRLPSRDELRAAVQPTAVNAVVGISELPNNAGWGVRCLAASATAAREIANRLFSTCVRNALGSDPAPRRK
jgi:urease accessory protein